MQSLWGVSLQLLWKFTVSSASDKHAVQETGSSGRRDLGFAWRRFAWSTMDAQGRSQTSQALEVSKEGL